MSTGKVVLGVLAGFAAGTLVGILFAPEKGSVTRKKIADMGEDYMGELKNKFHTYADALAEKYNMVMKQVDTTLESGGNKKSEA